MGRVECGDLIRQGQDTIHADMPLEVFHTSHELQSNGTHSLTNMTKDI